MNSLVPLLSRLVKLILHASFSNDYHIVRKLEATLFASGCGMGRKARRAANLATAS